MQIEPRDLLTNMRHGKPITKPGDLPIEQPTKVDLIVNLRTARALGIPIPPAIMVQAARVIGIPSVIIMARHILAWLTQSSADDQTHSSEEASHAS